MTGPTNPPFRAAHAGGKTEGGHWADITRACLGRLGPIAGNPALGFVYATDHLAPHLREIVDHLHLMTGIKNWVGTIGIGILAHDGAGPPREYFDEPALAVMVTDIPEDSFRLLPPQPGGWRATLRALAPWKQLHHPILALVHADPRQNQLPGLLRQMSLEGELYLAGGLVSSRTQFPQVAGSLGEGALSGIVFGAEVKATTGLTQGCVPIGHGHGHRITRAQENIVIEIDGKPALDVFKAEIGEILSRDLARIGGFIFAALPVEGSDTGDYLVRAITGIDPASGWIAIGDRVETGRAILFARRDGASAAADLDAMTERVAKGAAGPIRGGIYVSCLARGPNFFGPDAAETRRIIDRLGPVPLIGFFANGEISHDRLYTHTGILTLFR